MPLTDEVQKDVGVSSHDLVGGGLPDIAKVETDAASGKIVVADVVAAVKETKEFWKTSEFWGVIAVALTDVATTLPVHDKTILGIIAGAYAIARGLAKNGVPHIS